MELNNVLDLPILSLAIFLPAFGALAMMFLVKTDKAARWSALAISVATFLITLPLWTSFDISTHHMQFEEFHPWIEAFNINYRLGVDGISMPFIILTSFLTVICIVSAWECIQTRVKEYMMAFLVLETTLIGVFASMDFVLFYIFWESLLIPMYLIIGIWGGKNRILCDTEVLPLHAGWLCAHAGSDSGHVLQGRTHFRHSGTDGLRL